MASALSKFFNVDGSFGRKVMPLPHNTFKTPEAVDMDKLSALDRINQISDLLKTEERAALESFILLCSGGTLETMSFHEMMHWWAMCGYTYQGCLDYLITWKFR